MEMVSKQLQEGVLVPEVLPVSQELLELGAIWGPAVLLQPRQGPSISPAPLKQPDIPSRHFLLFFDISECRGEENTGQGL